eukprot:GHVT01064659.1.p1 GENE.GHVT01064659.1~~GHVT01064659.1.p1  ORF type:complete len:152 (-),score=14.63 GHVT01064659.1:57-512(-)
MAAHCASLGATTAQCVLCYITRPSSLRRLVPGASAPLAASNISITKRHSSSAHGPQAAAANGRQSCRQFKRLHRRSPQAPRMSCMRGFAQCGPVIAAGRTGSAPSQSSPSQKWRAIRTCAQHGSNTLKSQPLQEPPTNPKPIHADFHWGKQ